MRKVISRNKLEPTARREVDKISRNMRPAFRATFANWDLLIEGDVVTLRVLYSIYDLSKKYEVVGGDTQRPGGYWSHGVKISTQFVDIPIDGTLRA